MNALSNSIKKFKETISLIPSLIVLLSLLLALEPLLLLVLLPLLALLFLLVFILVLIPSSVLLTYCNIYTFTTRNIHLLTSLKRT